MKQVTVTLALLIIAFAMNGQSILSPGKAPTEIIVEVEINAPIETVWAEFANIGGIYLNSPTVDTSYTSSEQKTGIGATRHMILSPMMKKGATLDERAVTWEEGSYLKMEVFKTHKVAGIQTMIGDFKFTQKGDKTILVSKLNYSMTSGMWGMMNKMMGKKKFSKVWRKVIGGYKHHIETGAKVTHKTKLDIEPVKLIDIKILKSK